MKKERLLKDYSFTKLQEYFDMIIESVSSGQYSSAKVQFCQLAKEDRIEFLTKLANDIFNGETSETEGLLHSTLKICLKEIY